MIKLITTLTIISILAMTVTLYIELPIIYLCISLIVSLTYSIIQCYQRTQQQKISHLIIHGQVIENLLYTVWVFFLQSKQYIFYLPLAISLSNKIYQLSTSKQDKNQTLSENYILLQGKMEFLMLLYLNLLLFANIITFQIKVKGLVMFIIVVAIFRIKYQLNYAFQRSINQIHLFFDRLCKKLGFRNLYHSVYKLIIKIFCVNDYNTGKRVIRY